MNVCVHISVRVYTSMCVYTLECMYTICARSFLHFPDLARSFLHFPNLRGVSYIFPADVNINAGIDTEVYVPGVSFIGHVDGSGDRVIGHMWCDLRLSESEREVLSLNPNTIIVDSKHRIEIVERCSRMFGKHLLSCLLQPFIYTSLHTDIKFVVRQHKYSSLNSILQGTNKRSVFTTIGVHPTATGTYASASSTYASGQVTHTDEKTNKRISLGSKQLPTRTHTQPFMQTNSVPGDKEGDIDQTSDQGTPGWGLTSPPLTSSLPLSSNPASSANSQQPTITHNHTPQHVNDNEAGDRNETAGDGNETAGDGNETAKLDTETLSDTTCSPIFLLTSVTHQKWLIFLGLLSLSQMHSCGVVDGEINSRTIFLSHFYSHLSLADISVYDNEHTSPLAHILLTNRS